MTADSRKRDRTASRLQSTVLAAEPPGRTAALATFLSTQTPAEAAQMLDAIVEHSCTRAEYGLVFLALLPWNALRSAQPEWDWELLLAGMERLRPGLALSWRKIATLGADSVQAVIAKTALLLEIGFILNGEVLHGSSPLKETGADLALRVLEGAMPDGNRLGLELASYPVECRKELRSILSEMDFVERSPGSWQFVFGERQLESAAAGSGLDSHRGSGAVSSALAGRNAESLVKRLELLIRTMQMFPSGHPSIKPTVTSFLGNLEKFYSSKGQATLSLVGDSVMVNDITIRRGSKAAEEFVRALSDRQISSITFLEGATLRDIIAFSEIFNRPPAYIASHGGMAKLLESRNLETICVNRFHYELISGEEDSRRDASSLDRQETALEDAIFSELLGRLERGESLSSMSGQTLGEALKSVLSEEGSGRSVQRGTLARLIVALDPSLLEKGLLASEHVQRGMAWGAVRTIIDRHLLSLSGLDPDTRHEAADSLEDLSRMAVERGKDNTVLLVIEKLTEAVGRETDPDVLFRLVATSGALLRALMAHGMVSTAVSCSRIVTGLQETVFPDPVLEEARRRAVSEALGLLDSLDAAESLVQRILSDDRRTSRLARQLIGMIPPSNLVYQLIEVFREDNRQLRAKAYQMLRILSATALPALHARLEDMQAAAETVRDGKTGRLIDGEWYCARNVIQVLRDMRAPSSREILERLCLDPDPRIRRECLAALSGISKQSSEDMAKSLLNDASAEVASMALQILGKAAVADPGVTTWLIRAYERNPRLSAEFAKTLSLLSDQTPVAPFLANCIASSGPAVPFGDREAAEAAIGAVGATGDRPEMELLIGWAKAQATGLFRKPTVGRALLGAAGKAVGEIRSRLAR